MTNISAMQRKGQKMAVTNSLTNRQEQGIASYLNRVDIRANIESVVGKNTDTFIAGVVSAVQTNPALSSCTKTSILSGALLGEALHLSPSPQLGEYYLVPYKNKGVDEAVFQCGYRGLITLAIRSGVYKHLNALAIKEGELVKYDPLREEIEVNLIEDEEAREKAKTIGYYGYYELLNGFTKSVYWSRTKMEKHALRYSKGYQAKKGYTFWEKDFDGMAIKTIYRTLLKTAPKSVDMQRAIIMDGGVVRDLKTDAVEYVDNSDYEPTAVNGSNPSDSASGEEVTVEAVKVEEMPADEPNLTESVDKQASLFN